MKEQLTVEHKEGKAIQAYSLKRQYTYHLGDITLLLYDSSNFFGEQVCLGFCLHIDFESKKDDKPHTFLSKAAIRSKEDSYDPVLGRQIVLGRLIQAFEKGDASSDGIIMMKTNDSEIGDIVFEGFAQARAEALKDFIMERNMYQYTKELTDTLHRTILFDKFQEFK